MHSSLSHHDSVHANFDVIWFGSFFAIIARTDSQQLCDKTLMFARVKQDKLLFRSS